MAKDVILIQFAQGPGNMPILLTVEYAPRVIWL